MLSLAMSMSLKIYRDKQPLFPVLVHFANSYTLVLLPFHYAPARVDFHVVLRLPL